MENGENVMGYFTSEDILLCLPCKEDTDLIEHVTRRVNKYFNIVDYLKEFIDYEVEEYIDTRLPKIKENSTQLEQLFQAYKEFCFREYDSLCTPIYPKNGILEVAYTDECFDSNEEYEYAIQYSLNLNENLDIYEMTNEYIKITISKYMELELMILNLGYSFDKWVSCENGLDFDLASELINNYKNGINQEKLLAKLQEKDIVVEFKPTQ